MNSRLNRNILKGTLLATACMFSVLFTGCQNNDNDIWDKDPIVRLEEAKVELKSKLVDSENGWIVSFSPDGNKFLGNFHMWVDFKDNNDSSMKTDLYLDKLDAVDTKFNFTVLNSIALNFPLGTKIHEFTSVDPFSSRSDIEFIYQSYVDDNTIEFKGHMSGQKVYFRKATAEEKAFRYEAEWNMYALLDSMTKVTLVQDGKSKALNMEANEFMRSAYIGKITESNGRKQISETLTETGAVTFTVEADGEISLKPVLELENGLTIDKLVWIGNAFYGEADSNNTILIRK